MLKLETALSLCLSSKYSNGIENRTLTRMICFLSAEQIEKLGFEFKNDELREEHTPVEWTKENVLKQLEVDLDFAFEKALDKRGISANLMFYVVLFWNEVLESSLSNYDIMNYAQYGLPLLKLTALEFDMKNKIGDDLGDEVKYAE